MSKVKLYTWADKAPEFIYKQYETMKKFIKDEDWEFIVINNTRIFDFARRMQIKQICKELGIKCIDGRFRTFYSGTSYITGWGIQWAYHRFFRWEKDVIHVVIDSDMFFLKDFNFNEYLEGYDFAAIHQRREHVDYMWNGFFFMRGGELPDKNRLDFRLATVDGVRTDVGGATYYWLKRHPEIKVRYIPNTDHEDVTGSELLPASVRDEYKKEYNFQFIEDFIVHSRGGSNWKKDTNEFLDEKKAYLNKMLDNLIQGKGEVKRCEELYIYKQ